MLTQLLRVMIGTILILIGTAAVLATPSRIKDIANFEGIRDNQLIGYGLVVGLNGTGDIVQNSPFTEQSIEAMLERLGVNVRDVVMRPENTAAVMVTADLPAFARQGTRIDVTVASIGDAEELRGGTLIATPLLGADGEVYAVAQGAVSVSGFNVQGEAASVVQGVPTSGQIANGAIVEREIDFALTDLSNIKIALRNPDLTTATRVASVINNQFGDPLARAIDPATVQIDRPIGYRFALVDMLTSIEQLEVEPDQRARVLINEKSGVIVLGEQVRISPVALAQGNLTISITEEPQVSQPNAFAQQGQTQQVNRTGIDIQEDSTDLALLPEAVTLQELVDGLNALGFSTRDMITILQAIKAAGAMQAELVVF